MSLRETREGGEERGGRGGEGRGGEGRGGEGRGGEERGREGRGGEGKGGEGRREEGGEGRRGEGRREGVLSVQQIMYGIFDASPCGVVTSRTIAPFSIPPVRNHTDHGTGTAQL